MAYKTADRLNYGILKDNARKNRRNPTEAEYVFWQCVRCNALGDKCIRQHALGEYIVDFLFRKSMLIVEIDGGYHRPNLSQSYQEGDTLLSAKTLTGDLIVDFAKKADTAWCNDPEQIQRDKVRQEWLEHQGYKVLRFSNEQVLFDTENVINEIKKEITPNPHIEQ